MYRLHDELGPAEKLGIQVNVVMFTPREDIGKREIFEGRGESLKPEDDGFLVAFSEEYRSFGLIIRTPNQNNFRVVLVSSGMDKCISTLTNLTPNEENGTCIRIVPTHELQGMGRRTTKPADNSLRIIVVNNENLLTMFEVAIATRTLNEDIYEVSGYFLTVQKMYETPLYVSDQSVVADNRVFPGFKNWYELKRIVAGMVEKSALPAQPAEALEERKTVADVPSGHAKVLFFNPATGLGKAVTQGGAVGNIHWSKINTNDRFPFLAPGQEVSFSAIERNNQGFQLVGVKEL